MSLHSDIMAVAARVVIVLVVLMWAGCTMGVKVARRDTYLTAYLESHGPGPGEVLPPAEYGPPTGPAPVEPSAEPHANPLDPIHAKIVLLFKVLLKLLIFKLIVKFIAIICVFLFLPKLSELEVAKEDSSNRHDEGREEQMLFIIDAISGKQEFCSGSGKDTYNSPLCRLRRAMDDLDSRFSVPRLFQMYTMEKGTISRHKPKSRK